MPSRGSDSTLEFPRASTLNSKAQEYYMSRIDLTGQRFGRLEVLRFSHTERKAGTYWECLCDCGEKKVILYSSLARGDSKSCGCWARESTKVRNTKHGYTANDKKNKHYRTYSIWQGVKNRCYNKNVKAYKHYGGRGIKVCPSWLESFENFLKDMGNPPAGYSIERVDVNGDYEPGNCKWVHPSERSINRQNVIYLELNGERLTTKEWSKKLNCRHQLLNLRKWRGWSDEKILTTPIRSPN
jgi:hypothetical protein